MNRGGGKFSLISNILVSQFKTLNKNMSHIPDAFENFIILLSEIHTYE